MLIFWDQFGAKMKKSPSQASERAIKVIRLGFEPKTHSLEGCCSIQLSYRTEPYFFRKWVQRYAFSLCRFLEGVADMKSGCKDT